MVKGGAKVKPGSRASSKGVRKTEIREKPKKPKLTSTGQHATVGSGCIATLPNNNTAPCPFSRVEAHIPYCKNCMAKGDPSLNVVKHPKFGSCLVTTRKLPKGYVIAWWGRRIGKKKMPKKNWEWALESYKGVIDAVPFRKGSLLQYSQCPGPSEKPTVDFTSKQDLLLVQKPKTCLLFQTLCEVPKSHQLTMMYNEDEKTTENFFKERGLVRQDVGCPKFPALKKSRK